MTTHERQLTLKIDIAMQLRQAIFVPVELVDHKHKYSPEYLKEDLIIGENVYGKAAMEEKMTKKVYDILNLGHHFHECGYHLHPDAYKFMLLIHDDTIESYLELVRTTFDAINGFDLTYKTFFGNGKTAAEVEEEGGDPYMYAVMHYLSSTYDELGLYPVVDASGRPIDFYSKEGDVKKPFTDLELDEVASLMGDTPDGMKVLYPIIGEDEISRCMGNLLESNSPLSESLSDLLGDFYRYCILPCPEEELWYYKDFYTTKIACKETLAFVMHTVYENKGDISLFAHNINNATDVLRFYAAISGHETVLTSAVKLKRLNAYERKMMMKLLYVCPHLSTDVWKYPEMWKRAFERIHPRSTCKAKKYDGIRKVAEDLYNGKTPKTVNSIIQTMLVKEPETIEDILKDIQTFEKFPSQFAEHFDHAIRRYGKKLSNDMGENVAYDKVVCTALMELLPKIPSTRLILRLFSYYGSRMSRMLHKRTLPPRVVKVKGAVNYTLLPSVSDPICTEEYKVTFYSSIINRISRELIRRFMRLPYMGNIYIDPFVASCVVPMELREANDMGMRFLGRGSAIPMKYSRNKGYNTVIVPFIHWTNPENGTRTDIDLSVGFMDQHFNLKNSVSYRNLVLTYDRKIVATHSGDYVDGGPYDGEGVSEFILCRLNAAAAAGYRYIMVQVHDYTRNNFNNKNTFFGLQVFLEPESTSGIEQIDQQRDRFGNCHLNVALNPDATVLTSNIQSQSNDNITVLIDLQEEMMYWVDLSATMNEYQSTYTTLHTTTDKKVTMYENEFIDAYITGSANPDTPMNKYVNDSDFLTNGLPEGMTYRDMINKNGNNIVNTAKSAMTQLYALINKPYVFMGDLLRIHAESHGNLVAKPEEANVVFTVPESEYAKNLRPDQELLTPFMVDRWINEFMMVQNEEV